MLFFLSRVLRKINKIKTPEKCYAELYLSKSNYNNNICDCLDKCKYDPTSTSMSVYVNNIKLHKNQYI